MVQVLNKSRKAISEDKRISIAIMSSFAILAVQYLILVYFNLMDTPNGSRVQFISKVMVGFFFMIALPSVLRRNKIKFIGVYLVSIAVFLLTYLFFQENIPYVNSIIFPYFFTCLPALMYSYSINNWNIFEKVMKTTSLMTFIIGIIIGILVFTSRASVGSYSMPLSYYMLLPATVYINEFFSEFNFKPGLFSLISILIILALGSRGAIMCIGVFVILSFIKTKKRLTYKTILIYLIVIAIVVILLFFLNDILESLYNILLHFGIESRSIKLFLRGDLYLSGRDLIYVDMLRAIKASPIFGIGLAGDRRIIGGAYAHNILIEIFADFGIIFGSILILLLAIISYKALFSDNKISPQFISLWFSIGAIPLLVSGSYLIDFKFWIFLGLAINAIKYRCTVNET